MYSQQPYGMNYDWPVFDGSTSYNHAMPAYYSGNVQCGEKGRNHSTLVLLVVLFILLIIVGSTFNKEGR